MSVQPDPKQVPEGRTVSVELSPDAREHLDDIMSGELKGIDPKGPCPLCDEIRAALDQRGGDAVADESHQSDVITERGAGESGSPLMPHEYALSTQPESGSGEEGELLDALETFRQIDLLIGEGLDGNIGSQGKSYLREIREKIYAVPKRKPAPTQPLQGSEVERYEHFPTTATMRSREDGEWVNYRDYTALQAQLQQEKDKRAEAIRMVRESFASYPPELARLRKLLRQVEEEREKQTDRALHAEATARWEERRADEAIASMRHGESLTLAELEKAGETSGSILGGIRALGARATQAEARVRLLRERSGPNAVEAVLRGAASTFEDWAREEQGRIHVAESEKEAEGHRLASLTAKRCAEYLRPQSSSEVGEEEITTAESWSRLRLRRMHSTEVEVVQYVGGFPLCLLRDGEKIRAGDCVVMQPGGNEAYLHLGDWLIRWDDGRLCACPPEQFETLFEPALTQPHQNFDSGEEAQPVKTHWLATRGGESWLLGVVPDAEGGRRTIAMEGRYADGPGTDAIFHAWPSPKQAREIADALRVRADEADDAASPSTPRDEEGEDR